MSIQGTYQASSRGFGFFTPEGAVGRDQDLFVPPRSDGGAWNGDVVTAEVFPDPRSPGRQTAAVTAVLERTNRTVIGAVERRGHELWLVPSSDRLSHDVKIAGHPKSVRPGDKVAVSLSSFGSAKLPPIGTVKAAFGRDGTRPASVEAILYNYDIERDFPAPVRAAAELAPETVEPEAMAGRLDRK